MNKRELTYENMTKDKPQRRKLISLDEYNKISAEHYGEYKPQGNGIGCPKCGEELTDSMPSTTLLVYPPKKRVECLNCNFRGTRVV